MRIVIDNNQVREFTASKCKSDLGRKFNGMTLSPYVLAEIFLRSNSLPSRRWLLEFDLRLGLDIPDAFKKITESNPNQIPKFQPFACSGDPFYDWLLRGLTRLSTQHMDWARKTKQSQRKFSARMGNTARDTLADLKKLRAGGTRFKSKFKDMCDALLEVGNGPDSFLGSLVTAHVTVGSRVPVCSDPKALFDAIMENQYLHSYFRGQLYYILCITWAWKGQRHNFAPKPKHDDATDLSLLLYTGINDKIVTADRMLKRAVPWIEPSGRPSICKELSGQTDK